MNSYEHTSREFLPLSVIRSACAGDTDCLIRHSKSSELHTTLHIVRTIHT